MENMLFGFMSCVASGTSSYRRFGKEQESQSCCCRHEGANGKFADVYMTHRRQLLGYCFASSFLAPSATKISPDTLDHRSWYRAHTSKS